MARLFSGCVGAVLLVIALLVVGNGGERAAAAAQEVHHVVVGDDLGWDLSSNVAAWAKDKIFRVGDEIWFAYSAAEESVVELQSKAELESCDLRNPIRMYTSGLDKVTLHGTGARYFTSATQDNCKSGLKLHVQVLPQTQTESTEEHGDAEKMTASSTEAAGITVDSDRAVAAAGPQPSASARVDASSKLLWIALAIAAGVWF